MLSTATSCHRTMHRPSAYTLDACSNRLGGGGSHPEEHDTTTHNGQTWKLPLTISNDALSPRQKQHSQKNSDWALGSSLSVCDQRSDGHSGSGRAYYDDNMLLLEGNYAAARERITVNVSGERYQTYADTLERFPGTLLGNRCKRSMYYCCAENEYFFDRDRHAFNAILYFYQSGGQLYCPVTVPMNILVSEAKFFELGNDALKQVLDIDEKAKTELPNNKLQREVWKLFEHPDSSKAANILTLFSVIVIILSVAILCTETLPNFKRNKPIESDVDMASVSVTSNNTNVTVGPPMANDEGGFTWKMFFDRCEVIFVTWFTFEFLVRFLSSPNKCEFLKNVMNLIDILSISPYYITTAVKSQGDGLSNFRIFRLVRVFRIFKLSRHSRGLQILGLTLKASMRELGLLIFFLAIGVILFSSAVYYVEANAFESIPDAFWWAIVTMCTVGYGDMVPKTFFGKLVGSACAVSGVLTIALPVPVIVSNFDYFYNRERTRRMHQDVISNTDLNLDKGGEEDARSALTKSPDSTTDEVKKEDGGGESFGRCVLIQRQSELRKLEAAQRKLSQRLTELAQSKEEAAKMTNGRDSLISMPAVVVPPQKNGNAPFVMERESCV